MRIIRVIAQVNDPIGIRRDGRVEVALGFDGENLALAENLQAMNGICPAWITWKAADSSLPSSSFPRNVTVPVLSTTEGFSSTENESLSSTKDLVSAGLIQSTSVSME